MIAALPSLTWASTILVDDDNKIYSFAVGTVPNPPPPAQPYTVFSQNGGASVSAMAVTYNDAAIPSSPYEVLVASGSSVYAYSSVGVQSTFISGVNPVGLAIDGSGNVYTAAAYGTTVNEYGPTGSYLKTITGAPGGDLIDSLLADSSGDLYVADNHTRTITEYLAAGGTKTIATGLNGNNLDGMAFDDNGDLFVSYLNLTANTGGGIFEITPAGTVTTFYSSSSLYPTGLAFDFSGDLYLLYTNSPSAPGGGIEDFSGQASGTPSSTVNSFATGLYEPAGIVQLTPEPGTTLLLTGGLIGLGIFQGRRLKRPSQN